MIVNNYPPDMASAIPVIIVVMYSDEFPGIAQAVYIPVVSTITVSGKHLIILMTISFTILTYICLISFAI